MAGQVVNPWLKILQLSIVKFWHLPLTMPLQPPCMRRITWPMRWAKFFPHIWNPWPWFAY